MAIVNPFIDGLFFRGGMLAAGILCLYLSRNDFLPRYMNPVSYGMTTLGIFGVVLGLASIEEDEDVSNVDLFDDVVYKNPVNLIIF